MNESISKSVVPVCYITDAGYYWPTITSMFSLLENGSPSTIYDVYLITSHELGPEAAALDTLRSRFPASKISHLVAPKIDEPKIAEKKNHVSKTALLKYNICTLLPHLDKILYVDGDTIVQEDMAALFRTDLEGKYLAAALALIGYRETYRAKRYDEKVGVPFDEYINTGVMLLNLRAFREDDLPRKLFEFTASRRDLIFMDQDAINAVCRGRVVILPRRFNLIPECAKFPETAKDAAQPRQAAILHFAGKAKPWSDIDAPWGEIYQPYHRRSPAWRSYYALLYRRGAQVAKQHAVYPLSKVRRLAAKVAHNADIRTRLRNHTKDQDKKRADDLEAFAAQYFYLGRMLDGAPSGLYQGAPRSEQIVISLTTIRPRLYDISTTIESLLSQSLRPDRVVLWLDKNRVTEEDLPLSLHKQMERGLTVRFVEDVGPHTKLIPALREFSEAVIITVDDDVLYPSDLVERLYKNYQSDRSKIYATRARQISNKNTRTFSYVVDWPNVEEEIEGLDILPLGVGGVLYPPGIFDDEVFNLEEMKRLAPRADDVWFKAMSLRKGVVCKRIAGPKRFFPERPFSQEVALHHTNVRGGGNELQIMACFEHYSSWDVLGAMRDV